MRAFVIALIPGLFLATAAPGSTGTRMEAKVYFNNAGTLDQLGDLAGELDICTRDQDARGRHLVINTDTEQLARIRACGLETEITWHDIRDKFYAETGVDSDDPDGGRDFGFFLTYWEMQDSLDSFVARFPNICHKYSLGNSHQGRPIWCLKISDNPDQSENEPACFFNGAIHAREPMTTSCVMTFAARILSEYGSDRHSLSKWLIDNREIFLVPVENPDGYIYNSDSGGASSNWRKNRHPYPGGIGVDLNRNYAYKWAYDDQGSSPNPSSWQYRGPHPFSEPAAAVIRDLVLENKFRTCLDYHTYGQYNLYPWGYDRIDPPEKELLQEMVDTFRMNNNYRSSRTGQIARTLYPCNGIASDWEYCDSAGKFTSYTFLCELSTSFWRGWDDSVHIREECGKNVPNLYYLAKVAGAYFDPVSVVVNDSVLGNSTGELDPGETAHIWFTIRNRAVHPLDSACDISARLVPQHSSVMVLDSIKGFPNTRRQSTTDNRANQFLVRAGPDAVPGTRIFLRLEVSYTDDGQTYMQSVRFEITIGSTVGIAGSSPSSIPGIKVFPNPARNRVTFNLAPASTLTRLAVFANDGSLLMSRNVSGSYTWNCSETPTGVYFCRATTGRGTVVQRFNIVR